ncbi:MAG: type II CAAX prenyl endopeptidase Rce1 family protein [Candidatus Hodarchaeota archaeon]
MIAAVFLSLQFIIELPVAFMLFIIQLTDDIVINRLIVLFLGQVIGTALIGFVIIPFLKIRNTEFNSLSRTSFFRLIAIICLFWAIMIPITIGFSFLSSSWDMEANIYKDALPLSKDQISNLFIIFLWLAAVTLGTSMFKEYLYRRTLIPLLEERGMSPFTAIMISSLVFAFIEIPYALGIQITIIEHSNHLNIYLSRYNLWGSLFYAFYFFSTAFILGIACGITYVLTRNITLSVIIHCSGILPYYLISLLIATNNESLLAFLGIIIIIMNISGLFIALYGLWLHYQHSPEAKWLTILKKKSSADIKRGLVGFLAIFLVIVTNITIFLGLLAEHAPILITVMFHIIFLAFMAKNLRKEVHMEVNNSEG